MLRGGSSDDYPWGREDTRELTENGKIIRSKQWQATVPRDGH